MFNKGLPLGTIFPEDCRDAKQDIPMILKTKKKMIAG
jgi:hypothetical protein